MKPRIRFTMLNFFSVILLLWTLNGRGVDGERVTGVLNGRVEIQGRYGKSPDVDRVQWTKYSAYNLSRKMIFMVIKSTNTTCINPCRNRDFDLQTMSLILVNLTLEDEGLYEERTTLKNNTVHSFNFTLSLLYASNITVSCSSGSLTLKCEISGEFKMLRWFRNGLPLPDDQRFSFTKNNTTMKVSNPISSDSATYTCQVSNENGKSEVNVGVTVNNKVIKVSNLNISDFDTYQVSNENQTSEVHVTVNDASCDVCPNNTSSPFPALLQSPLFLAGSSVTALLVLCIIIINICKRSSRRNIKPPSTEEAVYNEITDDQVLQDEPSYVNSLLVVYQDFIKPKDSHQSNQDEDFGYSTIPDVVERVQLSQIT